MERSEKSELLDNLTHNVYATIGVSQLNGVGVFAIRDIPSNVDVFKLSNVPVKRQLIKLTEAEVDSLPNEVRTILKKVILPDAEGTYSVPDTGLNGLDVSYYVNSAKKGSYDANCISLKTRDDCRGFNMIKTKRLIRQGEELLYQYGEFKNCTVCAERNAIEDNIVGCGCSGQLYCEPCALDFYFSKRVKFDHPKEAHENEMKLKKCNLICPHCKQPVSDPFTKRVDSHKLVTFNPPAFAAGAAAAPLLYASADFGGGKVKTKDDKELLGSFLTGKGKRDRARCRDEIKSKSKGKGKARQDEEGSPCAVWMEEDKAWGAGKSVGIHV